MNHKSDIPVAAEYFLKPGFIFLASFPTTISTVLGSSVSVCIYDRKQEIGGINHFLFPCITKKTAATANYGNVATMHLIRMLLRSKCKLKNLEAQILGGADNHEFSAKKIGWENIAMARKIITKKIAIVSEDVGGNKGRKIVFNSKTGDVAVFKTDKLRQSDWYPYESDR